MWSDEPRPRDAADAARRSDTAYPRARRGGSERLVAAWSAAAVWSARRVSGGIPTPAGPPVPSAPEGGADERIGQNSRSSSRVRGAAPERPAPGRPATSPGGSAAPRPTGPAATGAAGAADPSPASPVACGSVGAAPPRLTAPPGAQTETGGGGTEGRRAPEERAGGTGRAGLSGAPDTPGRPPRPGPGTASRVPVSGPVTEHDLLIAQVQDLDRRIARMDELISLLEADIERNDLTFAALAGQRLRLTTADPEQKVDGAPAPARDAVPEREEQS
ncbi:conserved hypothetical protein [Frankia sp. Hr75.2]|nr:conserved hypothetical protein [Frankia sp. Hr75.2]